MAEAEQGFKKMEEEGVPKVGMPTEAAQTKKEEQDLSKLTPAEFRVYNRMAEHMDMFVRAICSPRCGTALFEQ